jgi:phosphonate transport system substrate-binding protein
MAVLNLGSAQENSVYTISIIPQAQDTTIYQHWQPIADYLSQELDPDFRIRVQGSVEGFEEDLYAGVPDFAFVDPYHELIAMDKQGYLPLLRSAYRQVKGLLLVRKDSPIQTIQDLVGESIAFATPNICGASLLVRAELSEQEIDSHFGFVGSHANAYRHVLLGKTAAAGGNLLTLSQEPEETRENLRILYETPGFTPHPLSVHPRVPTEVREGVTEALVRLWQTPRGRQLLDTVHLSQPQAADYENDYATLNTAALENYLLSGL